MSNDDNKLLNFIKENYPFLIKDNEINMEELKSILDLFTNGYGLNFAGKNNVWKTYSEKTNKKLKLNTELSKDLENTQYSEQSLQSVLKQAITKANIKNRLLYIG